MCLRLTDEFGRAKDDNACAPLHMCKHGSCGQTCCGKRLAVEKGVVLAVAKVSELDNQQEDPRGVLELRPDKVAEERVPQKEEEDPRRPHKAAEERAPNLRKRVSP